MRLDDSLEASAERQASERLRKRLSGLTLDEIRAMPHRTEVEVIEHTLALILWTKALPEERKKQLEIDALPLLCNLFENIEELDELLQEYAQPELPVLPGWSPKLTARPRGTFQARRGGSFLYVARDADKRVIYVGITNDVFRRMVQHQRTSKWWPLMVTLDWEEWPSRDEVEAQERRLILRHRPPFNKVHNPEARR